MWTFYLYAPNDNGVDEIADGVIAFSRLRSERGSRLPHWTPSSDAVVVWSLFGWEKGRPNDEDNDNESERRDWLHFCSAFGSVMDLGRRGRGQIGASGRKRRLFSDLNFLPSEIAKVRLFRSFEFHYFFPLISSSSDKCSSFGVSRCHEPHCYIKDLWWIGRFCNEGHHHFPFCRC